MKMSTNITSSFVCVVCTCFVILGTSVDEARTFKVGGELGWREPDNMTTIGVYGQWAGRNRFRVGDSLLFDYKNDSVLEVDKWDYYHCNTRKPIIAFNNGNSLFKLDRSGSFYFISGALNHCRNGQRLLVEVMGLHHHRSSHFAAPPEAYLAPSSHPSSGALVSATLSSASAILVTTFVALVWSAP